MEPIPHWFNPICYDPSNTVSKFKAFFATHDDEKYVQDLVHLFGQMNAERIESFLPDGLRERFSLYLTDRGKRFGKIWVHFQKSLLSASALDFALLGRLSLYKISAFTGENPRDLLIDEIFGYLLSRPMPFQESKDLNCYSIVLLKPRLDRYAAALKTAISSLLQAGDSFFQNFSTEECCLLFKTSAVILENQHYSWGELFFYWGKTSGNVAADSLHNLLITEKKVELPNLDAHPEEMSFKQYVINLTLHSLFNSAHSPFPLVESVRQELAQALFDAPSDEERESVVYYIATLSVWLQQEDQSFPFALAHEVLNSFFDAETRKGVVYNFLHASMHYFYALHALDVEDNVFLLEALYAVPLDVRVFFDSPIKGEKYPRSRFKLSQDYVLFARNHQLPLSAWGGILLRFAQEKNVCSSSDDSLYLNSAGHLELVQKIENLLGLPLPSKVVESLFFFQTAQKGALESVQQFAELRSQIFGRHLDDLSLPPDRYKAWEDHACHFIDQFLTPTLQCEQSFSDYRNKIDCFPGLIFGLAHMLQIAIYPKGVVSFSDLVPERIELEAPNLLKGALLIEKLNPFDPEYTEGPFWMARWKLDGNGIRLVISIMNSSVNMRTCGFSLKLPHGGMLDLPFFKELVDGLGKEALSDEEVMRLRSIAPTSVKKITALEPAAAHLKFDWYMSSSPLLQDSYLTNKNHAEFQNAEIRGELFEFVRSLHALFRRAFYSALIGTQAPAILLVSELSHLYPFDEGFYLQPRLAGLPLAEVDVIRYSDYRKGLEKIYQEWKEGATNNLFKASALQLKIGAEKIEEAPVDIEIKDEVFVQKSEEPDEEPHRRRDVHVTCTLLIDDEKLSLRVTHCPFKDKAEFVRRMVWQLALLKQDFITG